jgi:hypothetical protein
MCTAQRLLPQFLLAYCVRKSSCDPCGKVVVDVITSNKFLLAWLSIASREQDLSTAFSTFEQGFCDFPLLLASALQVPNFRARMDDAHWNFETLKESGTRSILFQM